MSVARSFKIGVASTVGGAVLVVGGLFLGGALANAEEPTPTPAPGQEQAAPGTQEQRMPRAQNGTQEDGDCPGMDGEGGSTAGGVRFRGGSRSAPAASSGLRF